MRFCGMCGASLAPPVEEPAENPAALAADDVHEPVEDEMDPHAVNRIVPAPTPAPAYTGGTFRLMGQEVMSHETDSPSRNLDYLLDDDEEPRSGGGGWFIAFLLALALAAGLGYWHYRTGGWPWAKIASAVKSGQDAAAGQAANQPADQDGSEPANQPASAENTVSAPAAGATGAPAAGALTDVRPQNPSTPTASPRAPAAEAPAPARAADTAKQPDASTAAARRAATPADVPAKVEDPVTLGEKYIYGRGLPQNCERGLKLVRPAADAANGKAMITMGALYATGHCVNRDLPTAYRYFALALRKDPENGPLKQNAEMVWGQMTQSERQQAIRLTQ